MSPKSITTALIYIQFMRTDIQTTLQTLLNTNTYSNMRGKFFPFLRGIARYKKRQEYITKIITYPTLKAAFKTTICSPKICSHSLNYL